MPPPSTTLLERHGRRMARARWIVIPLFLVLMAGAFILAGRSGDVMTSEMTLPGSEAGRAIALIDDAFAGAAHSSDMQPVFRHPTLTVDDPEYRDAATAALRRAADLVPGTRVVSYFDTGSRDMVGQGGHMTFATLSFPLGESEAVDLVPEVREAIGTPPGFEPTLVGGDIAMWHDMMPVVEEDLARAHMIVLPAALLILLIFFGSAVSALVPLLMAGVTITLALAGTWAVGQSMEVADLVTNVIMLVGIAIGIDYSLLLVSRFREEMRAGADRVDAVGRTVATAGRAVLLAGIVVAIGLAVLVALPVPFMRSMGIGGMLVPASAVLAGLTVLPALLAVLGPRIDSLRVYPRRWRMRDAAVWGPVARVVTGWGAPIALLALAAVVALASQFPGLSIHQDGLADAPDREATQAGLLVREELGGAFNPNLYVIDAGAPGAIYRPETIRTLAGVADSLRAETGVVSGVTWPATTDVEAFRAAAQQGLVDPTGRIALMHVAPHGDESSPSARALNALMDAHRAEAQAAVPGGEVLITGGPAMTDEFTSALYGPFPWLVAGVLILTMLALMRAFRSWVVPLVGVALAGLSLLATYGLLYLVFQRGIGAHLLGVDDEVRGIAEWVPLMLFAFLFGIAMDYQVFLSERMRELRDHGSTNLQSVRGGLASTGRVVGTAALIMIVAFGGFAAGTDISMTQFGFGLAAAVAIDALVVRCIIMPALLRFTGERTWDMPPRLARVARIRPRTQSTPRSIGETS